jgi:hypothetical protein
MLQGSGKEHGLRPRQATGSPEGVRRQAGKLCESLLVQGQQRDSPANEFSIRSAPV